MKEVPPAKSAPSVEVPTEEKQAPPAEQSAQGAKTTPPEVSTEESQKKQEAQEACVKAAEGTDIEVLAAAIDSATTVGISEDVLNNARGRLQTLRDEETKRTEAED